MKEKSFNRLLLFSLFGIALGFFGNLYEGLVILPQMLDTSVDRMVFWKNFYAFVSPVIYYIPLLPLATIVLGVLYFRTSSENKVIKRYLLFALLFQILSLVITFCIVNQVNLKMYFSDLEKYSSQIPSRTSLANILSIGRLIITLIALNCSFKAYLITQTITNSKKI